MFIKVLHLILILFLFLLTTLLINCLPLRTLWQNYFNLSKNSHENNLIQLAKIIYNQSKVNSFIFIFTEFKKENWKEVRLKRNHEKYLFNIF